MRGIIVDAADQKMVGKVFHRFDAGLPAVGTKVFTQRAALLFRVDVGMGGPQLAQLIMVELAVSCSAETGNPLAVATADQHLVADIVNTGHMLSAQSPEIVSKRAPESGVNVVVFDQVSDIHNPMLCAPVAKLI